MKPTTGVNTGVMAGELEQKLASIFELPDYVGHDGAVDVGGGDGPLKQLLRAPRVPFPSTQRPL